MEKRFWKEIWNKRHLKMPQKRCRGFKKDYKNNKIYPCLQARGYKFKFNKNNGS